MVSSRVFAAPPEQVWQAWSDSDLVRQWWGPEGFTCPLARMDFREGGATLVCMRAPQEYGGQDMYNTWTYRKLEPHQRIEFVVHFSDPDGRPLDPAQLGLQAGIPNSVPHAITFKPLPGGQTEVTVTEYGYTTQAARDLSKSGLEQCLDKMARLFT